MEKQRERTNTFPGGAGGASESALPLGAFRTALLIGCAALSASGVVYARLKGIPYWAALPVLAAFLLEYSFYLVSGFASARERLAVWLPGMRLPWALSLSALPPYLVYSLGTGRFHWLALVLLVALASAVAFWYVVLPRSPLTDAGFVLLLAGLVLGKCFDPIYLSPVTGLHIEILGQLMLIHVAAIVMLMERRMTDIGFGFLPNRKEWNIGIRHFLYFLPAGFPLALALGAMRFDPGAFQFWKAAGTFLGILWVVALSEEFLFRGVLQQWIGAWTGRPQVALVLTALLFGSVHLPFRSFPNWKFALVAAVAGWFYGRAYNQARSIRASMVTHACVVTVWRTLFT